MSKHDCSEPRPVRGPSRRKRAVNSVWLAISTQPLGVIPSAAALGQGNTPREALDDARVRVCHGHPALAASLAFEPWLRSLTVERVTDGQAEPRPALPPLSAPFGPHIPPSLNSSAESEGPEGADSPSSGLPTFVVVSPSWHIVGWGNSAEAAWLDAAGTAPPWSADFMLFERVNPSPALVAGEAA